MNILAWIFRGKKPISTTTDPIWSQVPEDQICKYQLYFDKLLDASDLDLNTRWSRGIEVDQGALDQDSDIQAEISLKAREAGLNEVALQIMLWQYFYADELLRPLDRKGWAQRVRDRQAEDYFPSSEAIFDILMKAHQSE
ncbi:MAG: hypothetical protein ACK5Z6_11295 [Hyphomonadaceae bacterium]